MLNLKRGKLKVFTAGIMLTMMMGMMLGCGNEKNKAEKKEKASVGIV